MSRLMIVAVFISLTILMSLLLCWHATELHTPFIIHKSSIGSNIRQNFTLRRQSENHRKDHRHIAFLKVHKAASSSVQNIFLRYGYTRNLTFVLPRVVPFEHPNVISINESVNLRNILPVPVNRSFDILCCHVLFNKTAFASIMPKDTIYIASVRHPFQHFMSVMKYFLPPVIFRGNNDSFPISKFLRNPSTFVEKATRYADRFIDNRMITEFGFPRSTNRTKEKLLVEKFLKEIDQIFHLVIVVERFEESLILLRRLLGWDIQDVIYMKKHAQRYDRKVDRLDLLPGDEDRHKEWEYLDYQLYDYFYKRLIDKIDEMDGDFQKEVEYFRKLHVQILSFCKENSTGILKVERSKWNKQFYFTNKDCKMMSFPEPYFIELLRKKLYPS